MKTFSLAHLVRVARRNTVLLTICAILGGAVGVGLSVYQDSYTATVLLGVRPGNSSVQSEVLVQSAAAQVVSPVVIEAAAKKLAVNRGTLAGQVSATVESGTTLINLNAANSTSDGAVKAATAVANAALADYRSRNNQFADDIRTAGEQLLSKGQLATSAAEQARQQSIGSVVGAAQGQAIEGTVTISVVSPALEARRAGLGRIGGLIFGIAMGLLVGILLALSEGLRRRRKIRNRADLEEIPGLRAALPYSDTASLAGTVLNTEHNLLILSGRDEASRRNAAAELVAKLGRNGYSVALVQILEGAQAGLRLAQEADGTWTVGSDNADDVLSRASRRTLAASLKSDIVIIEVADPGQYAVYLAGQTDFLPIMVVPQGDRASKLEHDMQAVATAQPVALLVDR